MIESLMLIALGFFIATLFATIAAQFVWRRAVTVTLRKMNGEEEAADTTGPAELEALAERHESEIAPLRTEIQSLKAENTRLADANDALTREKAHLSAEADRQTSEIARLKDGLAALREEVDGAAAQTARHAENVAAIGRELASLERALGEGAALYDSARGKLAALENAPAPKAEPVQALEPYPQEEQDADARTLAEVKASLLAEIDGTPEANATADEDDELPRDEPPGGGRSLAERIRALEQGVAH